MGFVLLWRQVLYEVLKKLASFVFQSAEVLPIPQQTQSPYPLAESPYPLAESAGGITRLQHYTILYFF